MGTLIDSSVLIAVERGDLSLSALDPSEEYFMSAVTTFELLHGVYRANTPERRAAREATAERFIQAIPVIPFDERAARVLAPLGAKLMAAGKKYGIEDLMIAATALVHGYRVATRDMKSFPQVPNLTVAAM